MERRYVNSNKTQVNMYLPFTGEKESIQCAKDDPFVQITNTSTTSPFDDWMNNYKLICILVTSLMFTYSNDK